MKIGYFQFNPQFDKVSENLSHVANSLKDAEADIIVLPELAFTGYFFEDRQELESLAENPLESGTVDTLIKLCRERDFYLVTGFAERSGDKIYNSSLLIGPEGVLQIYRKIHLFNTEKEYFDAGDQPFSVATVRGAKIGMMICFDWVFPEAARTLALKGADIICHPSNLVLTFCQQTMLSRCLENSVFAVTCNRTGAEQRKRGSLTFTGQSQVVAPKGVLLCRAGIELDELNIVEIDPRLSRNKSITANNDLLLDRRPEFYTESINCPLIA